MLSVTRNCLQKKTNKEKKLNCNMKNNRNTFDYSIIFLSKLRNNKMISEALNLISFPAEFWFSLRYSLKFFL